MANLHSYPLAIPRETERRTGSGLRRTQSHPKKELQLRPAVDSGLRGSLKSQVSSEGNSHFGRIWLRSQLAQLAGRRNDEGWLACAAENSTSRARPPT